MQSALLIGNGLNRCYKNAIPWDKLLERIANEYHVGFNEENSFPLEFESIANQILDKDDRIAENVYDEIKLKIANMVCSQTPEPNSLQRLFTSINFVDCILTTNYDYMLEKAFTGELEPQPDNQDKSETNTAYTVLKNIWAKRFIIFMVRPISQILCALDMSTTLHIYQKCVNT